MHDFENNKQLENSKKRGWGGGGGVEGVKRNKTMKTISGYHLEKVFTTHM